MKGLYIHIPFCITKCRYCDFVSFTGCENLFGKYIDKLCDEMKEYKGEMADTIFIGGGTPSLLCTDDLKKLVCSLKENFDISKDTEFTMESNPKTLSYEKLCELREIGINRLSIGIQSFNDNELKKIGRVHNFQDAYEAVVSAKRAGFSNINIDLMFSLPGQTEESLKYSLKKAMELDVPHISYYSLILEEGTPLFKEYADGVLQPTEEETERNMYDYICRSLKEHGFLQYEISNFAKKGYECKHNLKYWDCDEYIGLGTAAHSYYCGSRYFNTEALDCYLDGNKRSYERLTDEDKIKEFVIMGFRKTEGISKKKFFERFHLNFHEIYGTQTQKFKNMKLMEENEEFIRLSHEGISVSNAILCEFV